MSPTFNEDELIFVDPEVEPSNGKYVVARLDDENEATFKQLIIEGGHKFLKAANPAWPTPIQPSMVIVRLLVLSYFGRNVNPVYSHLPKAMGSSVTALFYYLINLICISQLNMHICIDIEYTHLYILISQIKTKRNIK